MNSSVQSFVLRAISFASCHSATSREAVEISSSGDDGAIDSSLSDASPCAQNLPSLRWPPCDTVVHAPCSSSSSSLQSSTSTSSTRRGSGVGANVRHDAGADHRRRTRPSRQQAVMDSRRVCGSLRRLLTAVTGVRRTRVRNHLPIALAMFLGV
jgi:hypothetical protein